jgi:uncharacterized protein YyaL (SSP411 family)
MKLATIVPVLWLLVGCSNSLEFTTPLPGAPAFGGDLSTKLDETWAARDPTYTPRTRHLNPDGTPKYVNRLFLESSPYLRQHAHNPVNWLPWGDEAFQLARELGRPVLLSVGYSTCHWCHVMEEESFEDEEIAQVLNENYIAIKVDREVRPDIDAIYMSAVQLLTGGGGWPMTVWLTPERQPFSGGTYFPARDGDRGASVGFLTVLRHLKSAYDEDPAKVTDVSGKIAAEIRGYLAPDPAQTGLPDAAVIARASDYYRQVFDPEWGGARGTRKFPSGLPLRLLLRHHRRTGDEASLSIVIRTLEKMAAGGIHDQIGGGFHRYATDERWRVPHFEKMLYDNALLALAYLEAHQVTGRQDFREVARSILTYVEREMTAPEGGFYSATDADSPAPDGKRVEGWYFTWTPSELEAVVGPDAARLLSAFYGVTQAGDIEGRSVLHVAQPLAEVANEVGRAPAELNEVIDRTRALLYDARRQRPAPLRDDKVLTAWNGMMISAFAQAALVLGEPAYVGRASRAADYLLTHARQNGRLLRTAGSQPPQPAYLEDYAFLIAGLLDLYEATSELRWLEQAIALDAVLAARYEDVEHGGFFRTADDHEALLVRQKPIYDEAEPSGNAVALHNLVRLHEFTTDDRYRQRADRTLRAFGRVLAEAPSAAAEMLIGVDFRFDTPKELVIVVPSGRSDAEPFLAELRSTFLPNRILAVVAEGGELSQHSKVIPLVDGKYARDGRATAYVCENHICDLPTTDPKVFAQQIRTVRKLGS